MHTDHEKQIDNLLEVAREAGGVLLRILVLAILMLALAVLLQGCASAQERTEIRHQVIERIKGRAADAFFLANGPASRQYTAANGLTVYDWTTHPPGTLPLSRPLCTISLTVDPGGTIVEVRSVTDAVGFRRLSACDEVLR